MGHLVRTMQKWCRSGGRGRDISPGRARINWPIRLSEPCIMVFCGLIVLFQSCMIVDSARAQSQSAADGNVEIVDMTVTEQGAATCLRVLARQKINGEVFAVGDPERVVVDTPNAVFRLPRRLDRADAGLVSALRYGRLRDGKGRIVLDVRPDTHVHALSHFQIERNLFELHVVLAKVGASLPQEACVESSAGQQMAAGAGAGGAGQTKSRVRERAGADAGPSVPGVGTVRRSPTSDGRPVVVIDPGHGGLDPGAVVNKVYLEKTIVLAVAQQLKAQLQKGGQFRVVMTRSRDKFVSLDQRVERSRLEKAALFISLHADSIGDAAHAAVASGAAVYVLSHRASDAEARLFAEKENAVDALAGILPKQAGPAGGVRNILVDLLKRETERESARLRKTIVKAMKSAVRVARQPYRSAAFHVLKQTETPAALIELGYMTNPRDIQLMRRADWQNRVAGAIARAIRRFFVEK